MSLIEDMEKMEDGNEEMEDCNEEMEDHNLTRRPSITSHLKKSKTIVISSHERDSNGTNSEIQSVSGTEDLQQNEVASVEKQKCKYC